MKKPYINLLVINLLLVLLVPSFGSACDHWDKVDIELNGVMVKYVDRCLAPMLIALNNAGIKTLSSCCGHGKQDGYILCENRLIILSKETDTAKLRYSRDFHQMSQKNHSIFMDKKKEYHEKSN
jgi:hypothetical protein